MNASDDILLVLCTCPTGEPARALATALVDRGLAACVNELPGIVSTYRWKGAVQHDDEALLIAKTTRAAYPELERQLTAMHPYELPEIVAVPITTGLPGYLGWVADVVAADAD